MAKTRMVVEFVDGSEVQVLLTAGDKIRARSEDLAPGSDEHTERALWFAAKRNNVQGTDGDDMQAWYDSVVEYDLLITQELVDEIRKTNPERADKMQQFVSEVVPGEASATPA